jgi:hypothetical protein
MVAGAAAEPDLELGHDREHDGSQSVNGQWIEPEAAEPRKKRLHCPDGKRRRLGCHRPVG